MQEDSRRVDIINHAAMMIGRERGKTLRNEVVLRIAGLNFNDVALLAKRIDRLDQKELDSPVRSLRQAFAGTESAARAFVSNLH